MLPTNSPLIPPSRRPSLFYGYVLPLLVAAQFFGQPTVYNFLSNLNDQNDTSRGEAFLLVTSIILSVLCWWAREYAWNAGKISSRSQSAYDWLFAINFILALFYLFLNIFFGTPMRI
jgi:hypothetical protein